MNGGAYRGHMAGLDGLRGLAILFVLAFHYFTYDHHILPAHLVFLLTRAGWLGVDLFFVLSGFLITGILLDAKAKRPEGYFRTFYVRRTLRIFPLYYAVLFLTFGVLAFTPLFDVPSFHELSQRQHWLWLYLTNWVMWWDGGYVFESRVFDATHFWSLAAEEQFYLLWPAVVFVLERRTLLWVSGALLFVTFALKAALAPSELAMMVWRSDALVAGAFLGAAVREPRLRESVERVATPLTVACAVALFVLAIARGGLLHSDPWMARFGVSLFVVFSTALVLVAVRAPAASALGRVLRLRPLTFLGTYSYGIYVLHWAFDALVMQYVIEPTLTRSPTSIALIDGVLVTIVRASISIGAAWLSFHLFEKHFLAWKDRWAPSTSPRETSDAELAT